MAKYIMNSGGVKRHPDRKRKFHQEVVKGLGGSPKILICSFAQPREDWNRKFQGYCDSIAEDMPAGVQPSFDLAMPAIFAVQCENADIAYLNGGDDHLLQYWMRQFDLPKLFDGKVVATNSASSDMLAQSYWTCDWRQCMDGLGIVPIKFIPHYQSDFGHDDPRGPIDWQKAYDELAAYGDTSLPIQALAEGTFIVLEQA